MLCCFETTLAFNGLTSEWMDVLRIMLFEATTHNMGDILLEENTYLSLVHSEISRTSRRAMLMDVS